VGLIGASWRLPGALLSVSWAGGLLALAVFFGSPYVSSSAKKINVQCLHYVVLHLIDYGLTSSNNSKLLISQIYIWDLDDPLACSIFQKRCIYGEGFPRLMAAIALGGFKLFGLDATPATLYSCLRIRIVFIGAARM
jgi:hypothetical protein